MRRIRRQRIESAITELCEALEAEHDGEGVTFAFADDVPSFSLAEFLMPHLGTTKDVAGCKAAIPDKVRIVLDVNKEWPCMASFEEPIVARYHGRRVLSCSIHGFTEDETGYDLNIRWQGLIKFPIRISKPGR